MLREILGKSVKVRQTLFIYLGAVQHIIHLRDTLEKYSFILNAMRMPSCSIIIM